MNIPLVLVPQFCLVHNQDAINPFQTHFFILYPFLINKFTSLLFFSSTRASNSKSGAMPSMSNNGFNCFMFAPPNYYEEVQETLVFPAPLALFKSFYFNHYEVVYLGFCKYQIYLFPQLRFRVSAYNPVNFPAALKNYHARYSPDIMLYGNFLVVVNINFCKF